MDDNSRLDCIDMNEAHMSKQIQKLKADNEKMVLKRHASQKLVQKQQDRICGFLGVLEHIIVKCSDYDGYTTVDGLKELIDTIVQIINDSEPIQSAYDDQATEIKEQSEYIKELENQIADKVKEINDKT